MEVLIAKVAERYG